MKKLISFILLTVFVSNIALADATATATTTASPTSAACDWSKIQHNANGTYTFSKALYLCVGSLVETNKTQATQIQDLEKAVSLKDLAISYSDSRATTWNNTAAQLETRLQKVDELQNKNDFLYFGLGIAAAIGVGFATARLVGR